MVEEKRGARHATRKRARENRRRSHGDILALARCRLVGRPSLGRPVQFEITSKRRAQPVSGSPLSAPGPRSRLGARSARHRLMPAVQIGERRRDLSKPRRSRANLRPPSRSASVIDRLLKNQNPLENRNNLRSSSPHLVVPGNRAAILRSEIHGHGSHGCSDRRCSVRAFDDSTARRPAVAP